MVLIEVEETGERVANPPKVVTGESSSAMNAEASRDASEGFDTASEAELSDDDGGGDGARNLGNSAKEENHDQHQEQEQGVPPKSDSPQNVSSNDGEVKQNALLEQANDAKLEGNKLFGDGLYEEALSRYELALQLAQEMLSSVELRSICHANRGTCFLKLGKYEDTIKECTKALELNPVYVKALFRRGEAHEKLQHFEEAIADMKKILEIDSSNDQARKVIRHLEPLAAEKREKMKEEMIGKLKEMGNSLLGRFGMSIDNFKAVQDPKTGSYSISFQK